MAPRKDDSESLSATSDSLSPVQVSTTSIPLSQTIPAIAASTPESTPTSVTNPFLIPGAEQTAAASSTSGGGLSSGGKIAIGVGVTLVFLGLLFAATVWLLKRRANQASRADAKRGVYESTLSYEIEEFGYVDGGHQSTDDRDGAAYGGRGRSASQATKNSKRSSTDYLKSRNRRESVGSAHAPGIAMEEAYTLFGGSTASFADAEEKRPLHHRGMSEGSSPLDALPARSRGSSLMDDGSRYPTMDSIGSRRASRSVSYTGGVDPFSDKTPTGSPAAIERTFTSPNAAAGRLTGDGSPVYGSPPKMASRRVSLQSGVGVKAKTPSPPNSSFR